ncbi:AMP-binding protein [Marinactinospora rubrisoli]|uniref:AMP-binding protein n=1 Tax=Marinactinospora rubrisoli TaxID=2715399 RepID=A0ABW2KF78_9ACTN
MPLAERIAHWYRTRPDALAVWIGADRIGFRALAERAAAVAAGLRAVPSLAVGARWGVPGHGRLLAVDVGNRLCFAELFIGGTAGDGACAVLDPAWPAGQTAEVLRRLRPDLLVADASRPGTVAAARECGVPVLVAGGPDPGGADGGRSGYAAWLAAHHGADPERELAPGADDSTFLIGFTSGTTGVPRGFRRARAEWRASLPRSRAVFGVTEQDRTLAPGPLAHGLGLYAFAEALHAGSAFGTLPGFDVTAVADLLAAGQVTRLVVVPTMLRALNRRLAELDVRLPGVTSVVSSGAALDPDTLRRTRERLPAAHVHDYYGASELGFVTVRHLPPGTGPGDLPDSVGTPFPGVRIEVRDTAGRPVPPGTVGTIHVRSPLACGGYVWGDGTGFSRSGEWTTVGDHGSLDASGTLHLVGRAGGMVITGGHNVHPGEVESALRRLDGVDDAVVVGVPDGYLGTVLVAVLTGPAATAPAPESLHRRCAAHLAHHKIPRRWYALPEWPLTPSGKIARERVAEWVRTGDPRLVPLAGER